MIMTKVQEGEEEELHPFLGIVHPMVYILQDQRMSHGDNGVLLNRGIVMVVHVIRFNM